MLSAVMVQQALSDDHCLDASGQARRLTTNLSYRM
jgi:hypothetical protein